MIASLTPFSLIDYPSKLCAIVWFAGCNLRCKYCYNFELINATRFLVEEEVLGFLQSRVGLLDGVVCSGGECSMWGERLLEFVAKVKKMGFCIKIDTNGSKPRVLHSLLERGLVDYVALDFKAPMQKLQALCGRDYFKEFEESFVLLKNSKLSYEVRTSFHSELLSTQEIEEMRDWLRERGYEGKYFVQGFVGDKGSLANMGESENQKLSSILGITPRGI